MARLVPLVVVLLIIACMRPAQTASADRPEIGDRIDRLEKRVADLEREVNELRSQQGLPPKPALDNKLIGSWGQSEPQRDEFGITGLRLESDGTFQMTSRVMLTLGSRKDTQEGKIGSSGRSWSWSM